MNDVSCHKSVCSTSRDLIQNEASKCWNPQGFVQNEIVDVGTGI